MGAGAISERDANASIAMKRIEQDAIATIVARARTDSAALEWLCTRRCLADIVATVHSGNDLTSDQATRLATIIGWTG